MKYKNWNRTIWGYEISRLPPGLTVEQIAIKLGKPYSGALYWVKRFDYKFKNMQGFNSDKPILLKPENVDWRLPNSDIARKFKVSRERVRQVRKREGQPKVNGRKA